MLLDHAGPVAALVALVTGLALVQQARSMVFQGVEVREGGGFAVIVLVETMVFLVAVSIALG